MKKETLFAVLITCTQVFAVQYEITDLGTLGGVSISASGINDVGYVVGTIKYEGTSEHPFPTRVFLWSPNQTILLAPESQYQSNALSINNNCEIVGSAKINSESPTTAFYWNSQDGMQYFDMPEGTWYSAANGINNSGQIIIYTRRTDDYWSLTHPCYTGSFSTGFTPINFPTPLGGFALDISDSGHIVGTALRNLGEFGTSRAYIWFNGQITFLNGLGGVSDRAWGVNASGVAVGQSFLSALPAPKINPNHAALWSNGSAYDLGTLGGTNSCAYSINENGLIVGLAETVDGTQHACLWQDTQIFDLNNLLPVDSGWDYLKSAIDINIHGQIVGQGIIGGEEHAYLLTPVPEPCTLLLFALGGLLIRKR